MQAYYSVSQIRYSGRTAPLLAKRELLTKGELLAKGEFTVAALIGAGPRGHPAQRAPRKRSSDTLVNF